MKDKRNKVIYVGKAKDLKKRVSSYFLKASADIKTFALVEKIFDIDFIVTANEVEALILEDTLIKKHLPKYNILLKDDKRFPFIKITVEEDYPRLIITRKRERDNNLYFGPYTSAKSMRETIGIINRVFPIRKCNKKLIVTSSKKPYFKPVGNRCLYFQMRRCLGPCQGEVSMDEYKKIIDSIILFLKGDNSDLLNSLRKEMDEYKEKLEFENAAKVRDRIIAIERLMEKQKIVLSKFDSKDFLSFSYRDGIYNITLIFVRDGKVIGKNNFIIKKKLSEMSDEEVLSSFIKQYYSNPSFLPERIVLSIKLNEKRVIEKWLMKISNQEIHIDTPNDELEEKLLEMARENSVIELSNYFADNEFKEKKRAILMLKKVLKLKNLPVEIEGFDISNISGTFSVGSMVKFINGNPAKNEYRKFKIRNVEGIDDFKMIEEVVYRRYKRLKENNSKLPDLILIDGGKGQLSSATSGLRKNDIYNQPIISLAKKEELIFVPEAEEPLRLNRHSIALKLLQNIRDEAHRFAIEYHRNIRLKSYTHSKLDDIQGVGGTLKNRLLKHFKSIENIFNASIEELMAVKGITEKIAKRIQEEKNETSKSN